MGPERARCSKGHANPRGQRFCGTCGENLKRVEAPPDTTRRGGSRWRRRALVAGAALTASLAVTIANAAIRHEYAPFWMSAEQREGKAQAADRDVPQVPSEEEAHGECVAELSWAVDRILADRNQGPYDVAAEFGTSDPLVEASFEIYSAVSVEMMTNGRVAGLDLGVQRIDDECDRMNR